VARERMGRAYIGGALLRFPDRRSIMGLWQGRPHRKRTGGRLRLNRKKRRFEIARELQFPTIGEPSLKLYRVRGANRKVRILSALRVNVYDPSTRTTRPARAVTVRENAANPNYVQRNIITRGALLETDLGLVRVLSRPGQDGVLNGVLVRPASSG
jgi:small subunit ribosomal protein S8e